MELETDGSARESSTSPTGCGLVNLRSTATTGIGVKMPSRNSGVVKTNRTTASIDSTSRNESQQNYATWANTSLTFTLRAFQLGNAAPTMAINKPRIVPPMMMT